MVAILDYLEIWENYSIIGRWCDQLLTFSSLVEKPPTLSDTTTSSLTANESLLQKRKHGGISGSYQCVQQINKKKMDRKTNALERVVKKMGEESFNALKEMWNAMKTGYGEAEWEQGEGVILGLMAQEDVCDSCVCIDIQLARDNLPPEEREHLVLEKGMHLQAAIDQRRFMSGFVKQYIAANAPQQPVPNAIIPDTIDDAPPDPIDDAFPEI
ncbi:unnamed protein product [Sphagnum balticum]